MAWQYSGYESQATDAERLAMLRLHIQEVNDQLHAGYRMGERSYDPDALQKHIERVLMPRLREFEQKVPNSSGMGSSTGRTTYASFGRIE
jgi:hypothetical protein